MVVHSVHVLHPPSLLSVFVVTSGPSGVVEIRSSGDAVLTSVVTSSGCFVVASTCVVGASTCAVVASACTVVASACAVVASACVVGACVVASVVAAAVTSGVGRALAVVGSASLIHGRTGVPGFGSQVTVINTRFSKPEVNLLEVPWCEHSELGSQST